ncbi:MAG TPA: decarboxylating 6-phosphogluconate dehydrogenase [Firmicutes bacterium]|nr:decarboxylating 6-phosphogluconate dehydrogenase [Bacillota bacterium]
MRLGMVGLGRMGSNMARRLLLGGHEVVVYNKTPEKVNELASEGAVPSESIEDMVSKLEAPKIVWLMLPAAAVEEYIDILKKLLDKGDIIIEGGNSFYKEDIKRAEQLKDKGIEYIDAGISGGVWGLEKGYASMYGGKEEIFRHIEPLAKTLAPENGYLYCGGAGAGHFVKMVHNGIEYAMMQAYGEGFELLKASPYGSSLDLAEVAGMWNNGSVIRSWLLELLRDVFGKNGDLSDIQGYVQDSGEARWTVKEAVDLGVAVDTITTALYKRFNSRQKDVFAAKVAAALRNEFGGHAVAKPCEDVKTDSPGAGEVRHAAPDKERFGDCE